MDNLIRTNSIVTAIDWMMKNPGKVVVAKLSPKSIAMSYDKDLDCFLARGESVIHYQQVGGMAWVNTAGGEIYHIADFAITESKDA